MKPGAPVRLGLLLVLCLVAACGFRLAGGGQMPPGPPIYLSASGFDEDQLRLLTRRLTRAGARLVNEPDEGAGLLRLRLESPDDVRLVSGAGSRSVRRVERRLAFSFRGPGDDTPLAEDRLLVQRRDLTLDDDNLLAADEQRAAIVDELEQALYNLLVNQLVRL